MGLFRLFSTSALEGTASLPFRGSSRSSSSLSCSRQRCLEFKLAICMVIYTATLCPPVIPKKLSQKLRESSSKVYSLFDTLCFHPASHQTEGEGTEGVGFIVAAGILSHSSEKRLEEKLDKVIICLHCKKT